LVHSTKLFPPVTLDDLLAYTIKTKTGCNEWLGRKQKNYPTITHKHLNFGVHRIVAFLVYGEPAPGQHALHSCDNPPCINPDHLRWGTQKENVQDTKNRNRRAIKRGERNGRAKLDDAKVKAIRAIHGTGPTTVEIAELYGVSNQIVSRIIRNEAWSHLVENR
jgi:hypothetical protein